MTWLVGRPGKWRAAIQTVTVGNGIGWSRDGSLMHYVDSPTRRIDVCPADAELAIHRRPFVTVEPGAGFPDGLTVDADGCVWVALWDGAQIRHYTPSGDLDRVATLPVRHATACAFGGPGLHDLYTTTAAPA